MGVAINIILAILKFILRPIVVLKDYPVLFRLGHFYIITAGLINAVAAVTGLLVATYFYMSNFPAETANGVWIWKLSLIPVSVLLFGKAFHFFALGMASLRHPLKHFAETAFYNQGGQIGIFIGTILFSYTTGINFLFCMDVNLTAGCLALAIGRIGCHSYGCCHGRATDSPFSIAYSHHQSKVLRIFPELANVPLVPTQLISAA